MPTTAEVPSNAFMSMLQRHRGGGLLDEASNELSNVVAGVHSTGKGGKLVITIEVRPAKRGSNAVVITDDVKTTIPQEESDASFWFADDNGQLSKSDPRQAELPLSEVSNDEEAGISTEAFLRKINAT